MKKIATIPLIFLCAVFGLQPNVFAASERDWLDLRGGSEGFVDSNNEIITYFPITKDESFLLYTFGEGNRKKGYCQIFNAETGKKIAEGVSSKGIELSNLVSITRGVLHASICSNTDGKEEYLATAIFKQENSNSLLRKSQTEVPLYLDLSEDEKYLLDQRLESKMQKSLKHRNR